MREAKLRHALTEGGVIATREHSDVRILAAGAAAPQLDGAALAPVRPRHLAGVTGGARVVRVARNAEQVESLREPWTSMLRDSLPTDIDYFLWSLREEPQVVRPHVLAVEREGRTEAIVAARLLQTRLPCRIGYSTIYAPAVRAICVLHDGLLGDKDPLTLAAILDELLAGLERREADVVILRQLELDSPLYRAAAARATYATRQHAVRADVRWEIELTSTPEGYLASVSSATRKGARRTAVRLEQLFGERLSIKTFREPAEVDVFLTDIEKVAARTYQRRLGVGYLGDARQRARMEMLMKRGWLRAYILYLDGNPVAFELGELYRGRFRSLAGGYDTAFGHLRVGAHLLLKTIEDLALDPNVSVFDFGLGDAEYKGKLAHVGLEEADFLLYARRPRLIWINVARTVLLEISYALKGGLRRLALLNRLKHRWRRRAADAAPASVPAKARALTRP
jgi:CelD/BcsL family acetyltransferase involved in cellulose biosynthesis